MAIEYVGGKTVAIAGSFSTVTNVSLTDLTGGLASAPAANDFVIVAFGTSTNTNRDLSLGTTGYTEIGDLYANDGTDANLAVFWKRMGSTPDTSVDVNATGGTAEPGAVIVRVWRDVDAITPLDVTSTTATRIYSWVPDPPAITPTTAGSIIEVFGVGVGGPTGSAAIGALSSSELSAFLSRTNSGASRSVGLGSGYFTWSSGAFNPAAFAVSGTDAATYSAVSLTLAMRPSSGAASGPVGLSTEAASAIVRGATRPAGLVSSTEVALALGSLGIRATGLSSETGEALVLLAPSGGSVGIAAEISTAFGLSVARPAESAAANDVALALTGRHVRAAGLASENETALALSPGQAAPAGLAIETALALGLQARGIRASGMAIGPETALGSGSARPAGLAGETGVALALAARAFGSVGLAVETSAALGSGSARPAGLALEAGAALAPPAIQIGTAGLASEASDALEAHFIIGPTAQSFPVLREQTRFPAEREIVSFPVDRASAGFPVLREPVRFPVLHEQTSFPVTRKAA